MLCTVLLSAWLVGCGAPGVQLAAPVPAPQRVRSNAEVAPASSGSAAQLASETLWVTVRDARQERPPQAIGVARMTMGIPRQIRQVGEWDLARALGHGLGTGLQNAGWEAKGFDPPGPDLAAGADAQEEAKLPGWTLRLILDQLWCDGYFNEYSFQLGLRLHLLDPSGRLRARAEFRREYVEEYKHPADFAYQVEVKTREALSLLLVDLGLARGFPGAEADRGALPSDSSEKTSAPDASGQSSDDPEPPASPACPKCERPVAATWKHCPDCGAPLPEPK